LITKSRVFLQVDDQVGNPSRENHLRFRRITNQEGVEFVAQHTRQALERGALLQAQQFKAAEAMYPQARAVFNEIGEQLSGSVQVFVLKREQAGV
jgi:hypothetical protein